MSNIILPLTSTNLAVNGVVLHNYIYSHNNLHTRNTIIKWGFTVSTTHAQLEKKNHAT